MSKPNQTRRMARPASGDASPNAEPLPVNEHASRPAPVQRVSKQDLILYMMRGEGGTSLPAMVAATGWLPHTARAALTGLRKKGHTIEKAKVDGETRYSIKAGTAQ
jgi:Protein of unknown function (DUF3489)